MRRLVPLASLLLVAAPSLALAADAPTLVGAAAYGDWRSDAPGMRRKLTEADLPTPGASPSSANPSRIVARRDGALPKAPAGFAVSLFAAGLDAPRVVRVAPNGDVFVAESAAGRVTVLSAADGAAKAASAATFAAGLHRPFGIAFYPPGPAPSYVYVAEIDRIVRFPYRAGETKATGPAEVVVAALPSGRGHWTRDLAVSADGKTLFVSVGSASNVADDMPDAPAEGLAAFAAKHALGAAWGAEENRADVLAFDPDGGGMRVYATGLRNCSGLTIQPQSGALWCAVNERDALGDDLPPDYAASVKPGAFYGWPWFYIGGHEDPRLRGRRADLAASVDRPRRADPGPLGAARDHVLRRRAIPRRLSRRRLRRAARLMEPRQAHRLQGRAAAVQGRRADRRIRGFPHRLRRRRRERVGAAGRRRGRPRRRAAGHRRRRRRRLARRLRGALSAPPGPCLGMLHSGAKSRPMLAKSIFV